MAAGEYDVTVNYLGDEKYFESSNATSFKVSKTDLIVGTDSKVTANVVGQNKVNAILSYLFLKTSTVKST